MLKATRNNGDILLVFLLIFCQSCPHDCHLSPACNRIAIAATNNTIAPLPMATNIHKRHDTSAQAIICKWTSGLQGRQLNLRNVTNSASSRSLYKELTIFYCSDSSWAAYRHWSGSAAVVLPVWSRVCATSREPKVGSKSRDFVTCDHQKSKKIVGGFATFWFLVGPF